MTLNEENGKRILRSFVDRRDHGRLLGWMMESLTPESRLQLVHNLDFIELILRDDLFASEIFLQLFASKEIVVSEEFLWEVFELCLKQKNPLLPKKLLTPYF